MVDGIHRAIQYGRKIGVKRVQIGCNDLALVLLTGRNIIQDGRLPDRVTNRARILQGASHVVGVTVLGDLNFKFQVL